jgi:hypothetical protein
MKSGMDKRRAGSIRAARSAAAKRFSGVLIFFALGFSIASFLAVSYFVLLEACDVLLRK